MLATLDHLGENVTSETEARDATTEVLDLLAAIEDGAVQSGVSVKLTQLGLDLSPALAAENLARIVARAAEARRFVRIDMESFDYIQPTLDLFEALWERYRNVGVVIQSYLYRSADDVARLVGLGASVRLVKGAYDEPPEVAYPDKADVDANFAALGQTLMTHAARTGAPAPVLGTHDIRLVRRLQQVAVDAGLDPQACEVHMLYGIRTAEQEQLLRDGYAVRVLISYGAAWFRWYMRRLAERPANVWFVMRSVVA